MWFGDGPTCIFQLRFVPAGEILDVDDESAMSCHGDWFFAGSAGEFLFFGTTRYKRSRPLDDALTRRFENSDRALDTIS
ncbi:MAG: hypothetical protein BRD55_05375 [Bacteroidetes bacterium SW_9_63_38]|nr:MAG: hypothetical protein BRD55_05375 [Bacteroidetes bacterium SW_9_63_38]